MNLEERSRKRREQLADMDRDTLMRIGVRQFAWLMLNLTAFFYAWWVLLSEGDWIGWFGLMTVSLIASLRGSGVIDRELQR